MNESSAGQQLALNLIQAEKPCAYELAELAQHDLTADEKDLLGSFFTPRSVVDEMVGKILGDLRTPEQACSSSCLEPAVGSGLFLIGCLEGLRRRFPLISAENLLEFAQNRLYGFDINPKAIAQSRQYLSRFFLEHFALSVSPNSFKQVQEADFLKWQTGEKQFDFIIGNPPYGLARDGKLSLADNTLFKQQYEKHRRGKINKYILFLAKSYELLSPSGKLSFLIPNAWLGVEAAQPLRAQILKDEALEHIRELPPDVFPEAGVETIIVILSKASRKKTFNIERLGRSEMTAVPAAACLQRKHQEILLEWNSEIEDLFTWLNANCAPLSDPHFNLRSSIALQAYAKGKGSPPQSAEVVRDHPFHSLESQQNPAWVPYLEGKDIGRYSISWGGWNLKYGPWLAEHQPLARYQGPRVLLREVLGKHPRLFRAAFTEQTFTYNRSVLHVHALRPALEQSLKALVCILNSAIGSGLFMLIGRKSQRRLFPKVLNRDLLVFPLPKDLHAKSAQLATLHDAALVNKNVCSELQEQIESAVQELYGMPSALRDLVTNLKG
jgi:methylase of polypeptide subunit release factors